MLLNARPYMAKSTGLASGWIVLMILVLGRGVLTGGTCSLNSDEGSEDSCTTVLTPEVLNSLSATDAQTADFTGTCDFIVHDCYYRQGHSEPGAPEWKRNVGSTDGMSWGRFEMKATKDGHDGCYSELESPELNIASASCLEYRATVSDPVKMAVRIHVGHLNCTLKAAYTSSSQGNEEYLDLPRGVKRIMFRGFGGGNTEGYAHIEDVSVRPGCCQSQEEWSIVRDGKEFSKNLVDCGWTNRNWMIGSTTAELDQGTAELTSPLIQASSSETPGLCASFEYFLPNGSQSSLSVSLVDLQNQPLPLWSDSKAKESTSSVDVFLMGHVSVRSGTAFKIRFTGEIGGTKSVPIKLTNVSFSRGNNSQCQFPVPEADADSKSGTTAVVVGELVAALLLLGGAVGGLYTCNAL